MILGNLVLASKTSRAPMSVASHVSTLTTTESIGSATHTPTNALSAEHAHRSARSLRYSSKPCPRSGPSSSTWTDGGQPDAAAENAVRARIDELQPPAVEAVR